MIIELAENCNLVQRGAEPNGHDCWGKLEWSSYYYVWIGSEEIHVHDGMYIIHDGKKVQEVLYDWELQSRIRDIKWKLQKMENLENTGFETYREYHAYLKGKNENLCQNTKG